MKYVEPLFRDCEFCGCHTNASIRRCCAKGEAADASKGKPSRCGHEADVCGVVRTCNREKGHPAPHERRDESGEMRQGWWGDAPAQAETSALAPSEDAAWTEREAKLAAIEARVEALHTGCTSDTQLTYGTWRVLVNDDGEPYAVDNGTSLLGVQADASWPGRANRRAIVPSKARARDEARVTAPSESNPSQPAPLAKDEAASLPSANLVKAAEAVVESWARADRADVFRVQIARLEGALIDEDFFDRVMSEDIELLAAVKEWAESYEKAKPTPGTKYQKQREVKLYEAVQRALPVFGALPVPYPKARLDADGTAKPLTELRGVVSKEAADKRRCINANQVEGYVVRETLRETIERGEPLIAELAKLDETDDAVLATLARPECVGDRDRAGTLLCSITNWDLDRTGGYARALADIEDAFADVRRETIQACAAFLENEHLQYTARIMVAAMTKKDGET